jgi:hypothetical protein
LVGDSVLLGVTYDSSADTYLLFRYSAPTGRLETYAPPPDLRLAVSVPAFSSDGQYLAYAAFPGDETGSGVVRRWPTGGIVVQTPSDSVPAVDVITGWADWVDAAHFEIYIATSDGRWVRFRGTVDPPGFVTDTVAPSPAAPPN